MKKLLTLLITGAILSFLAGGCSNNSNTGSNLLGGNGTDPVSFTMGTQQAQSGNTQFTWKPSVDVKITKLIIKVGGQQIDQIDDTSGQTYTANQSWVYPNEYTGVQTGQQWEFLWTGTVVSNNTAFTDLSTSYTIP